MTAMLQQMIDTVKNLAPLVWMIYLRQVMFEAYIMAAVAIVLLAIAGVSIPKGYQFIKRDTMEDDDKGYLLFFGGIAVGVIGIVVICCALLHINNPEYYAIRKFLPGGGCR